MKTKDAGIKRHRPRKKFRFEYIRGRHSGMTTQDWYWRRFDELEREADWFKWMQEVLNEYWLNKSRQS